MKVRIQGREYPAIQVGSAHLLHLMELQAQSKTLIDGGLGMSRLHEMEREARTYGRALQVWQRAPEAERGEMPVTPDCVPVLMAVQVFLTRRAAGDVVSFSDAASVGMDQIEEVPEPTDPPADGEGEAVDPTSPGSATPGTPDGDGDGAQAAA